MTKPSQFDFKIVKSSKIKEEYFNLLNTVIEYSKHLTVIKQYSLASKEHKKSMKRLKECRELLEEELPYWYNDIASNVMEILENVVIDEWTESNLRSAFNIIEVFNDGSTDINSVYYDMRNDYEIYSDFKRLKPYVWRICSIVDKLFPEIIELEKSIDIHFSLRDGEFEVIAELLEEIDNKKSGTDKCLVARSALERFVKEILEKEGESPVQGFYSNIDKLKKLKIIAPVDRKTIGAHYSFISQIIHLEKSDDSQNVLYAINGIYRNINFLLTQYLNFKKAVEL